MTDQSNQELFWGPLAEKQKKSEMTKDLDELAALYYTEKNANKGLFITQRMDFYRGSTKRIKALNAMKETATAFGLRKP